MVFLCVGPFALPLVWFNPDMKRSVKIAVTSIVIILSYVFGVLLIRSINSLVAYYKQIF